MKEHITNITLVQQLCPHHRRRSGARTRTEAPKVASRHLRAVDFGALRTASLPHLPYLLARWLPEGRREGHEWIARNPRREDRHPGSFKINMTTGRWADFATGEKGGDAVSLLAYLRGVSQIEAARLLRRLLMLSSNDNASHAGITPDYVAGSFCSLSSVTRIDVTELAGLGVLPEILRGPPPVKSANVTFHRQRFEFTSYDHRMEGVGALLFLVDDIFGDARDIVAWHRSTGQLASWLGQAWAIGQGGIYRPRLSMEGALPVWREPLSWLRAGGEGIVLVRPQAAAQYLADAGPLLAEDLAHGEELRAVLTRPAPRILVPVHREAAA